MQPCIPFYPRPKSAGGAYQSIRIWYWKPRENSNDSPDNALFWSDYWHKRSRCIREQTERVASKGYGEALTSDDFHERLTKKKTDDRKRRKQQQQQQQQQQRQQRLPRLEEKTHVHKGATSQDTCYVCGMDIIGCDQQGCGKWYHYWCAELDELPDTDAFWACPACHCLEDR